jgi:hypothetical protein
MYSQQNAEAILVHAQSLLSSAGDDSNRLGSALVQFQSAIEKHFRAYLARNVTVPQYIQEQANNTREIDWPKLLEYMAQYGDLPTSTGARIRKMNIIRNSIIHNGQMYRGGRQELEQYAKLIDTIIRQPQHSPPSVSGNSALDDAAFAMLGISTTTSLHSPEDHIHQPVTTPSSISKAAASQPKAVSSHHSNKAVIGSSDSIYIRVLMVLFSIVVLCIIVLAIIIVIS